MKYRYLLSLFVITMMLTGSVSAWNADIDRIPNGTVFSCDTCHGATTHTLNSFGVDYENASSNWTTSLAQADSDNDGYTNGEELLDPNGAWSIGQPNPGSSADVTNPGDASSHPQDPSPTPAATETPAVTQTPGPTETPGATATPGGCTETGVKILMPGTSFSPDDPFYCHIDVCNQEGDTLSGYPMLVLLDVFGQYFFAPSFGANLDYYDQDYPVGSTTVVVLPEFLWPAGAGSAQGINFYAAITDPSISSLIGTMDMVSFGWSE